MIVVKPDQPEPGNERQNRCGVKEVMTIAEVMSRFDSEWVLMANVKTNDLHEVQEGEVIWHSKDRDDVDRKLLEARPNRFATIYTGPPPEHIALNL